jgi:hypothetical protein
VTCGLDSSQDIGIVLGLSNSKRVKETSVDSMLNYENGMYYPYSV